MQATEAGTPIVPYHSHAEFVDESSLPAMKEMASSTADEKRLCVDRKKRFLCWHLRKKYWYGAWLLTGLLVLVALFCIVWIAVIRAIFQSAVDKVEISANYLDLKGTPSDPNAREALVEMSLHVKQRAGMDAHMDSMLATLYYDGKPFGEISLPAQDIKGHVKEFDLVVTNTAKITDTTVFTALARVVLQNDQVTVEVRARVAARARGLSVRDLSLHRKLTLKGLKSFSDPKPVVNAIVVASCTTKAYTLILNATLDNESQVGLQGLGNLNASVYYEQGYLGYAVLENGLAGIPRGKSDLSFRVTVENQPKTVRVLTQMATGLFAGRAQFYISGENDYVTKAVLLEDAIRSLNISVLYTDGLSKVSFSPSCDLTKLIVG